MAFDAIPVCARFGLATLYGTRSWLYLAGEQLGWDFMRNSIRQLGAVSGGVLLIVGSLMTWVSVDLGFRAFSATGRETTEGKLTLATGVVLIVIALLQMRPVNARRLLGYLAVAAALFGSVVLLLEYLDVLERIREAEGTPATAVVGTGVFVAALGAAAALVATVWGLARRPLPQE